MQTESLHAPFQHEATAAGLRITIPRQRGGALLFVVLVLLAMLIFFAYMDYSSIKDALAMKGFERLFQVVPVLFFTCGCYTLTRMFLCFRGRNETITVNSSSLEYRMEIFGLSRKRAYPSSAVRHLRLTTFLEREPRHPGDYDLRPLSANRGFLAFDYEGKTIRLAPALDEKGAGKLLKQLSAYLPQR